MDAFLDAFEPPCAEPCDRARSLGIAAYRFPIRPRDTFSSVLLERDAPITYVSKQVGHKDAAITLRVYLHWLPHA